MIKDQKELDLALNQLEAWSRAYHSDSETLVSDSEYDALKKEAIEFYNTLFDLGLTIPKAEKILKSVGFSSSEGLSPVTHSEKMLSLVNCFNPTDILKHFSKLVSSGLKKASYSAELKYDGLAASIVYRHGNLYSAATRGDGTTGENITHNILNVKAVPHYVDLFKDHPCIEVRGEVHITNSDFKAYNDYLESIGEQPKKTSRNAASGALRRLDASESEKANLSFKAYAFTSASKFNLKCHTDAIALLNSCGFNTDGYLGLVAENISLTDKSSADLLDGIINSLNSKRASAGYDTDGIVLKLSSISDRDLAGFSTEYPNWAFAYKFPATQVKSKVLDLTCQVGRLGTITPVAELEPTVIDGVTVTRATLHNFNRMHSKKVTIGSEVLIHRAGEVIPEIISAIDSDSTEYIPFKVPTHCPSCGSVLVSHLTSLYCVKNTLCPDQKLFRLSHFTSREALKIQDVGDAKIEALIAAGLLSTYSDFFKLESSINQIANLSGFAETSAKKLINSINASKNTTLSRLIVALGIPDIGVVTADTLAKAALDSPEILFSDYEKIAKEKLGDVGFDSFTSYFKANLSEIETLFFKSGITFSKRNLKPTIGRFSGMSAVVTGTFKQGSRDYITDLLESKGFIVKSSVSKKTDYVFYGEDAGSKLEKANSCNVKTISHHDLDSFLAD